MRGALDQALDLLLPHGCVACRSWMPRAESRDEAPICARCRSRMRMASWPRCPRCHAPAGSARGPLGEPSGSACFECRPWSDALTSARSAFLLTSPASDLVHALKYEGWHELAPFMARHMSAWGRGLAAGDAVVAPVPTTRARERRRGYNQAVLLGSPLASAIGMPLVHPLVRSDEHRSQIELAPQQRRANVRGAFEEGPDIGAIAGRRVLLVDDVLTTGATASEAACVLVSRGAASVHLVTFTRALPEVVSRLS